MAYLALKAPQRSRKRIHCPRKADIMSLKTYYSRILARGKPGFPTLEEARRDFKAMLAGLTPIHYG